MFSPPQTGNAYYDREQAIRTALQGMRRGSFDIDRAPHEDHPALSKRGSRSRRNRQRVWMPEKE